MQNIYFEQDGYLWAAHREVQTSDSEKKRQAMHTAALVYRAAMYSVRIPAQQLHPVAMLYYLVALVMAMYYETCCSCESCTFHDAFFAALRFIYQVKTSDEAEALAVTALLPSKHVHSSQKSSIAYCYLCGMYICDFAPEVRLSINAALEKYYRSVCDCTRAEIARKRTQALQDEIRN